MAYVAHERIGFRHLDISEVRRLSDVASAALARDYDIAVRECRFLASHSNVVFRIDTRSGETFALRVGLSTADTRLDTRGELAWINAVADGTNVIVARPVANRAGDLITVVETAQSPACYQCVLFTWLGGAPLAARLSPENYRHLGELAAEMHDFGGRWQPPIAVRPLVWDRVFYYRSIPVVLFDAAYRRWMTPACTSIAQQAVKLATAELDRLQRHSTPIYLHGNIEMWNVMVHDDRLSLLDFEEFMLGAAVQDVAMTLHYGRAHPDYPSLCAAFRAGYEQRAPWPVEHEMQLETLMAARTLMLMNHALRTSAAPGAFVTRASRQLARFVRRTEK